MAGWGFGFVTGGLVGRGLLILRLGSAPPRVFLFLLPQEKEPKEGEPSPPALRAPLRCSVERGGCGTRPLRGLKQSSPKAPRPPCAARRGWTGDENRWRGERGHIGWGWWFSYLGYAIGNFLLRRGLAGGNFEAVRFHGFLVRPVNGRFAESVAGQSIRLSGVPGYWTAQFLLEVLSFTTS